MAPIKTLDGSASALLKKLGFNADDHRPHWTFDANADRELIRNYYRIYAKLKLDFITTNTYHFGSTLDTDLPTTQSQKEIYKSHFQNACNELFDIAKEIKETEGHQITVLGSVGCLATRYHDMSEYNGRYIENKNSMELAKDYYHTVFKMFKENSTIRQLIVETVPTELETIALLAVIECFPEMRVIISFTMKENALLRHGEKVEKLASKMETIPQVVGVGINCTDPQNVTAALKVFNKYKFENIFVYPNIADSYFQTDDDTIVCPFKKEVVEEWIANGATVIGGCCGIDDGHILELKKILGEIDSK